MKKNARLVIVGDSAFAEVAFELFTKDSAYEVAGFSVEEKYLKRKDLFDLPVVPFEQVERRFPPSEHFFFVAIAYAQLNRLRTRLMREALDKKYRPASYTSSKASVWPNATLGEHCFVFENNVIQPFVSIGTNVILWSGNHIGHHSTIRDNVFVSSHVVVSGFVEVGDSTFLGVNSTISNNVRVGKDNWIAPSITVMRDTPDGTMYRPPTHEPASVTALKFFKLS